MHLTIRALDPASEAELDQYLALDRALDEHAYGGSQLQTRDQLRAQLQDSPYWTVRRWVALVETLEGGESLVGRASTFMPLQENLETLSVGVAAHAAFRGRGRATAMVQEALIPAIRESGRPLVEADGEIPADGDPDSSEHPVNRLAARLGISRKNLAVCRALPLPLEESRLDALQAEAAERLGDYRVELWDGHVPGQHLGACGLLLRELGLDEPDGEVEHGAPEYTPARIRERERRAREQGVARITAVAVAPDGSFVGNSEIHVHTAPESALG